MYNVQCSVLEHHRAATVYWKWTWQLTAYIAIGILWNIPSEWNPICSTPEVIATSKVLTLSITWCRDLYILLRYIHVHVSYMHVHELHMCTCTYSGLHFSCSLCYSLSQQSHSPHSLTYIYTSTLGMHMFKVVVTACGEVIPCIVHVQLYTHLAPSAVLSP